MANTDKVEWVLYAADLTTRMRILPVSTGHLYLEMNGAGSGEVKIPLDSEAAGVITSGMFVQNNYRGAERGGFFVENIKKTQVDTGENAGRWMSVSGRGGLALLDQPIVWNDDTVETTRIFNGMTKAAILIQLLTEAQARGALSALTWDFTASVDSSAVAWGDSEEYQITAGESILQIAQNFAEVGGFEFAIALSGGGFVLSAYKNGIGTNKSTTIFFRAGTNCLEISADVRGDDLVNAYLVKYKSGFAVVKDDTSISSYGRREKIINIEQAQTLDSATTYAAAKLSETKDPKTSHTIRAYDGVAPYLFVDYTIGDTVTYDVKGTQVSYRILSMQVDYEDEGYANAILELNTIFYDSDLKRARDLDWLTKQWNTARDADLLEVRRWMPLTPLTDTLLADWPKWMTIYGNVVFYYRGSPTGVESYNMLTGERKVYPVSVQLGALYAISETEFYLGATGLIGDLFLFWNGASFGSSLGVVDLYSIYAMTGGDGTKMYLGGLFYNVSEGGPLVEYDTATATFVDLGYAHGAIYSLAWDADNTLLYIGGTSKVYVWDGSTITQVGADLGGRVNALVVVDGTVYAAGEFAGYFAYYTGSAWVTIPGISDKGRSLAKYLSDVYVGGDFPEGIKRYSGGQLYSLSGGVDGNVYAIVVHDTTVIVSGTDITLADGVQVNHVAGYFTQFDNFANQLNHTAGGTYDLGGGIHGATAITTPLDADEFPLWKSSVQSLRKVTWSNIKATLAGLFVDLTNNQTAAGIKRFSDSIRVGIDPPIAETDGSISQAQEGVSVGNTLWTWGTGFASFLTGIFARGTKAAPTQALKDDVALKLRGRFHDGTNYGSTSAEIRHVADETHDATGHGTRIESYTTPIDSTTLTLAHTIGSDGLGRGSAMAFQRTLQESLTLNDGASLVVAEYMALADYDITLNGDAALHIL